MKVVSAGVEKVPLLAQVYAPARAGDMVLPVPAGFTYVEQDAYVVRLEGELRSGETLALTFEMELA